MLEPLALVGGQAAALTPVTLRPGAPNSGYGSVLERGLITPRGFAGPTPLELPPDVWVPFHVQPVLSPQDWAMLERPPRGGGWNWVQGIGRLREGVTPEAARADMAVLSAFLRENFAAWTDGGVGVHGDARLLPGEGGDLQQMLRLMAVAAAAVVLRIAHGACA